MIMKKILTKGLVLLGLLMGVATAIASESSGKMTLFILQMDRQRQSLENDAALMANVIQSATEMDFIQAFTTSGIEIFSFKTESKKFNQLQLKQAKNRSINDLRRFFINLFNNSSKEKVKDVDIAGSISLAMDRFNYAPQSFHRLVLVLLCDGLQRDHSINFKGYYPSDSWIEHKLSPFSAIAANSTKAKVEVVLVHQNSDYTNTYHAQKIRRWYTLLFQRRQSQLIGFTTDHENAAHLIAQGSSPSSKPVESSDLYGPLSLNQADSLTVDAGEDQ